jgi:ABC-type nickel/cobalt efflux system permease component RcnA
MGNFTINRFTRLTLAPGALRVHYVLDMAELPTLTERQVMDSDDNGDITDAETKAYLAARLPGWLANLKVTDNGKPLTLATRDSRLEFTAGVANLPVMRVEVDAAARLDAGQHNLAFDDINYKDRLGWKEVALATEKGIARPPGTETLVDISRELRAYPEALMNEPLNVSSASFTAAVPTTAGAPAESASKPPRKSAPAPKPVAARANAPAPVTRSAPAGPPAAQAAPQPVVKPPAVKPAPAVPATATPPVAAKDAPPPAGNQTGAPPVTASGLAAPPKAETPPVIAQPAAPDTPAVTPETRAPMSGSSSRWSRAFHDLVMQKALTPGALAIALLIAFFLGALHALQPGHGKTLVAAYLVGQHGTAKHAALLGLTVTITHTFGVFVLGAVALYASKYILPQQLFPWMGFASGLLIAGLGVTMMAARLREMRRPADDHDHAHEGPHSESHNHEHSHDHGHAHAHAPEVAVVHGHTHEHEHPHGDAHPDEYLHAHGHVHPHGHAGEHHHAGGLTHSHGPMGEHTHAVPEHISMKTLLALGIGGGIVPCWDALIVLLAAISLHRVGFGLLLIVAFSAGLAATLTAAGLAVVWGQNRFGLSRLTPGRVRAVSLVSHAVIIVLGVLIAWRSLAGGSLL